MPVWTTSNENTYDNYQSRLRLFFSFDLFLSLSPRAYRDFIYPDCQSGYLADEMTMISKAGYFQQNGYAALDDEGMPKQIAELNIHGTKYGIRIDELNMTLHGHHPARVERVFQNWQQYLGGIAGLARLSRSGKALNIELVEGGRYTVSLDSLVTALARRGMYASVGEIPEPVTSWDTRGRKIAQGQQTIPVHAT